MERIRELVESNGLPPGSRLPSERELREGLGVGRSTVREALRALEALGTIEIRQGSGIYVGDLSVTSVEVPAQRPTHPDWRELPRVVEARLPIETYAASLAALRRTPAHLDALEEKLKAFSAAMARNDTSALVLADLEFHRVIAGAANPVLTTCLDSIGVLVINSRQISLSRPERLPHVLEKHTRIYEAIAAGDPTKASAAMAEHLLDFISELGLEVGSLPMSDDSSNAFYVAHSAGGSSGRAVNRAAGRRQHRSAGPNMADRKPTEM
jgi:GntR family transcriptional repressor for pyruvate dehydrogenase complex